MPPKRGTARKDRTTVNEPWKHGDAKDIGEVTLSWLPKDLLHSMEAAKKRKYSGIEVSALIFDSRSSTQPAKVLLCQYQIPPPDKKIRDDVPSVSLGMRRYSDSDDERSADDSGEDGKYAGNFVRFNDSTLGEIATSIASQETSFAELKAMGLFVRKAANASTVRAVVTVNVGGGVKDPPADPKETVPRTWGEKRVWKWRTQEQVERMAEDFDVGTDLKEYLMEAFMALEDAGEAMEGVEQ